MKIEKKRREWGLPVGMALGIGALGYIYFQKENIDNLTAFRFIFFPMLATIGIAAIANLIFWIATGYSPRKASSGSPTNEERLLDAAKNADRAWLVRCYRYIQPLTMVGAGYISISPVIGIFLLR